MVTNFRPWPVFGMRWFVYYEEIQREVNRILLHECRCNERLKVKKSWGIYTTHIHWVVRGTGTPKDRDEVKRKEVQGCLTDSTYHDHVVRTTVSWIHDRVTHCITGEVWECEGWVCDLEAIGASSLFRLIRRDAVWVRMCPTFNLSREENAARR